MCSVCVRERPTGFKYDLFTGAWTTHQWLHHWRNASSLSSRAGASWGFPDLRCSVDVISLHWSLCSCSELISVMACHVQKTFFWSAHPHLPALTLFSCHFCGVNWALEVVAEVTRYLAKKSTVTHAWNFWVSGLTTTNAERPFSDESWV